MPFDFDPNRIKQEDANQREELASTQQALEKDATCREAGAQAPPSLFQLSLSGAKPLILAAIFSLLNLNPHDPNQSRLV